MGASNNSIKDDSGFNFTLFVQFYIDLTQLCAGSHAPERNARSYALSVGQKQASK